MGYGEVSAATPQTAQEKYDALVEAGIFEGFPDGEAKLENNMTRAQAAKIAALTLGLKEDIPSTSVYKDLKDAEWAAGFINAATNAGILQGKGNGIFDPSSNITIEELAKIMVEALGLEVDESSASDSIEGASDWAKRYVAAALKAGVIPASDDYTAPAKRSDLVSASYDTKKVVEMKEENKNNIGKLIALGVMDAKDGTFAGNDKLSKEDLIGIINTLSNGTFDLSGVNLSDNPSFADILRLYLQTLGYPASSLSDNNQLIEKAISVGIISEDSPLIKIQDLNLPLNRDWAAYITADTAFNASTVTVGEDGSIQINKDKQLSQTMKLPSTPIQVNLKDIDHVPTYQDFKDIDAVINQRITTPAPIQNSDPVDTDTTAPFIRAATINEEAVTISNRQRGSIILPASLLYLTTGTLTVNEASRLTITSIEDLDLSNFTENFFTQTLKSGENNLDLITKLGSLDSESNGLSLSYLALLDNNDDGMVTIKGILRDNAGNSRTVTLEISYPL